MLSVSNVTKLQGGKNLLTSLNFQINPGEKVGLVGPNGAGKTTIFRMIVGEEKPDMGQIDLLSNTKIAYFSQSVGEMRGKSALTVAMEGHKDLAILAEKLKWFESQLSRLDLTDDEMNQILMEMGDVQTKFEELGGYDLETKASEILTGLGIGTDLHGQLIDDFSGGWKMRIALASVLIVNPDIILMDEPTNYLDMETILWLENWLKNFKGAILMTCHDREFMNQVAKKIVEVSQGQATVYGGNYDFYEKEKAVRRVQNEAQFQRQQDMLKKEEEFIARFAARASHAAQVQSRVKKIDKIERVELESDEAQMNILLPQIPRGGNDVVVIKDLGKTYSNSKNEKKVVFEKLNSVVNKSDKIAVIGYNGAGKSTLLKIIAKQLEPTNGEAKLGPSIEFGYYGQFTLDVLNPDNTVFEELKSKIPSHSDGLVRNILAAFLFKGDDVFKKIRVLSGGEKSRVVLASLLCRPFNLLILDEPTNHLDMKSREVLLDALKRYEGTIMLVSHDRYFLHQLANRVLEVHKGEIYQYPGSYQEYLESPNRNH